MLLRAVTTLDAFSGGRAWLGLGAGYAGEEARSMSLPLPPASTSSNPRTPCGWPTRCAPATTPPSTAAASAEVAAFAHATWAPSSAE